VYYFPVLSLKGRGWWAVTYFSLSLDGWPFASANIMHVMNRKVNACNGNKYKDYVWVANVKRLSPPVFPQTAHKHPNNTISIIIRIQGAHLPVLVIIGRRI